MLSRTSCPCAVGRQEVGDSMPDKEVAGAVYSVAMNWSTNNTNRINKSVQMEQACCSSVRQITVSGSVFLLQPTTARCFVLA